MLIWVFTVLGCGEPAKVGPTATENPIGLDGNDSPTDADTDADADADSDADADADSDTDADADADADSDTDTDTNTTDDLDCRAEYTVSGQGSTPFGACVTEEVYCGDVIYGTNEGSSSYWDYSDWETLQSLGSLLGDLDAFDGPDRTYVFRNLQPGENVRFIVESCEPSWAFWVRHGDVTQGSCDAGVSTGGIFDGNDFEQSSERTNQSTSPYDHEIVIEVLHGVVGNYKLTVECF